MVNTTSTAKDQQSQETWSRGGNISPSFPSVGWTRRPKFWGEDDGPTVVVWESLSESEQEQWSKKMGRSKDWVVWCRSMKKDEEQRPFEVDGKKSSLTAASKQKPKQERRWIRKEAKGNQCTGKRDGGRAT